MPYERTKSKTNERAHLYSQFVTLIFNCHSFSFILLLVDLVVAETLTSCNLFLKILLYIFSNALIKWTVRVISSDLSFIEWHVRFTTIPFRPLLDQGYDRYSYLYSGKFSAKKPRECTLAWKAQCTL